MTSLRRASLLLTCSLLAACHAAPLGLGDGGARDAAPSTADLAAPDLAPPAGSAIGPTGGSVAALYFAIVGDTRPANPDDTANYPSAVIEKIYADIEALSPRPQFVVTTGDYMFASSFGKEGAKQMALYKQAAAQFSGPIFPAMGNHECTGATASNCASQLTYNMQAFTEGMLKPIGQTNPYFSIPFGDLDGKWTAKLVVAACNAWDDRQATWLQGELARKTTYTFVVRHEPSGTDGPPCVVPMDAMLAQATFDLFIVGHSHTFRHPSQKELVVGNGGAPLSGGSNYGFATVAQQAGGGFVVTEYDYLSSTPLGTFVLP